MLNDTRGHIPTARIYHLIHWRLTLQLGETALSFAAQCGHVSALKALIDAGADVNLPSTVRLTRFSSNVLLRL
jgi:hypothetical protein